MEEEREIHEWQCDYCGSAVRADNNLKAETKHCSNCGRPMYFRNLYNEWLKHKDDKKPDWAL